MKIEDAIKQAREFKPHDKHHRIVGISNGGVRGPEKLRIPIEAVNSGDWGITIENSDPEFTEGLAGLIQDLKENGPKCELIEQ